MTDLPELHQTGWYYCGGGLQGASLLPSFFCRPELLQEKNIPRHLSAKFFPHIIPTPSQAKAGQSYFNKVKESKRRFKASTLML
jgi:hypothetical protein